MVLRPPPPQPQQRAAAGMAMQMQLRSPPTPQAPTLLLLPSSCTWTFGKQLGAAALTPGVGQSEVRCEHRVMGQVLEAQISRTTLAQIG